MAKSAACAVINRRYGRAYSERKRYARQLFDLPKRASRARKQRLEKLHDRQVRTLAREWGPWLRCSGDYGARLLQQKIKDNPWK